MLRECLYWLVKNLCHLVLFLHNGLKIVGVENIPSQRPVIVAANHTSNLDPVVTGIAFPGRLRPLAKEELFEIHPIFTWLIRTLGAIPVSRATGQQAGVALKTFLSLLKDGENLMIFPEGQRSLDGKLLPIEGGITVLATKVTAPIVPLYISGTFDAMPVGSSKIKRDKITARFGTPIMPVPEAERGSLKEERERIRSALQNELARLEQLSVR
ncbi:MAG: lysophospholipid acyltransferase family protein [Pyramidobacter sp.]|nr:lysophospholipid acyltransferase family protein [Pyramidobacter sp.]